MTLLGVEANLHNISRWLRTLYPYPTIVARPFQDEIVRVMDEVRSYDERLFSTVEAALALIDVNRPSEAGPFVSGIMGAAHQAASLRSPMALIELVLRLLRIDQVLKEPCLEAVQEHITPTALQRVLSTEDAVVVPGFVYYLFRRYIPSVEGKYTQVLDRVRMDLQRRIRQSALSPSVLVAEMLLGAAPETCAARVRSIDIDDLRGFRPWEFGLIETMYAAIYQRSGDGLFIERDPWHDLQAEDRDSILSRRRRYFGSDISNIKCALSLRSSVDVKHMGLTNADIRKIAEERRSCDHRNAVRLLLAQDFQPSELAKYPYYLKVMLGETVFAPFRFEWSTRIINEVHSRMFVAA